MGADDWLETVHAEIPGATSVAVGAVDGGLFVSRVWGGTDPAALRVDLEAIVRGWRSAWGHLGGAIDFGSNDEILISASKGYLLLRVHHDKGRYVAVTLSASGNIGYLRFRMRDYLRSAAAM